MFTKLFHKELFYPEGTVVACDNLQRSLNTYFFSKHFEDHLQNQSVNDKKHRYLKDIVIECLNTLKTQPREVFEVELGKDYHFFGKSGWFVTKYCCRIPYDSDKDLVVAIRPQYKDGKLVDNMIVTAWINHKYDAHYTLDKSKYCSEEDWNNISR